MFNIQHKVTGSKRCHPLQTTILQFGYFQNKTVAFDSSSRHILGNQNNNGRLQ
uniref:Uncharacterized protein n=1 Tax=Anguilla anguilla TaxID=7936 RepID=A0A0E9PIR1_ANGAN